MSKTSLDKSKIKFLLLEGVHPSAVDVLKAAGYTSIEYITSSLPEAQLKEKIADAHFIGIRSRTQLTEEIFDHAKKLVAVGCFCIGTNQVDLNAARERGIAVFNAPYSNTRSVAELVLAEADFVAYWSIPKWRSLAEGGKGVEEVRGISYREGKEVRHNPEQPLLEDVDKFPFPARDLLPNEKYSAPFARHVPFGLILTARGCPFRCVYCATRGYYGNSWRARSVENVIAELKEMVERYRIRDIGFWDDTFTVNKKRVIEICRRIIGEKLKIGWICLARVDTVDPEILSWMKKAGCYQIQYGVESGDEEILRNLGKNTTVAQIKRAFQWSREAGIEVNLFVGPRATFDTGAQVYSPGGKGIGLGIDAKVPAFFRVGYNAGFRQLFLIWDLGFTREKPSARIRFCEFTFDPAWGFRSALARWYRIFPEYFRRLSVVEIEHAAFLR